MSPLFHDHLFHDPRFDISLIQSVGDIEPSLWAKVINTDYPFIQHGFLLALEESGATSDKSGWQPTHLVVKQDDELKGVMPLYLKSHSYGEYVFDFQWAEAYHQTGINYYPKLVTAIPYTPSTGKRFYFDNIIDNSAMEKAALYSKIQQVIQKLSIDQQISSWHILFPTKEESDLLKTTGSMARLGIQYHWLNEGYQSFEDFISHCKLKQRKSIKRERILVSKQGIEISILQGDEISENIWQKFFLFYQLTYMKRSGHGGYLNQSFFDLIGQHLPNSIVMIIAKIDDEIVAASLFFKDSTTLYGRYWGCVKEFKFLHFELCYYQGIEYCIKHQLKKFDAGAQGEHKIKRGFTPIKTYSNHWVANADFSKAIQDFVVQEAMQVEENIQLLRMKLPFTS